jgi:RNA polymerase sigma-70 factor, ECF subfamily
MLQAQTPRRLTLVSQLTNLASNAPFEAGVMEIDGKTVVGRISQYGSEDLWVERIRGGDEVAFEAFFRAFYEPLCRFAYRLIRDSADAEQLVQDVFMNIWQKRSDWSPPSTVRSYVYRATKNQALNYLRNRKRRDDLEELEFSNEVPVLSSPQEEYEKKELLEAVQQAIELLPVRCRLVFVLHRHDGLTYAEIADVLDISHKTVETQIGRALKMLRKILSPYLAIVVAVFHCAAR